MSSGFIVNSPMNRHERIRSIRLRIIIHTRRAEYNRMIKGVMHYDTAHEWEVVEELSAKLSNELLLLQTEMETQKECKSYNWENEIMDKQYD